MSTRRSDDFGDWTEPAPARHRPQPASPDPNVLAARQNFTTMTPEEHVAHAVVLMTSGSHDTARLINATTANTPMLMALYKKGLMR